MNPYQRDVQAFHEAMGATVGKTPAIRDAELRAKLIMEEAVETIAALGFHAEGIINSDESIQIGGHDLGYFYRAPRPSLPDAIDGICDLTYVALGTAVAAGIDLDPHWQEVQRANMAKLGGGMRADGKALKPVGWEPPDHESILAGEHK